MTDFPGLYLKGIPSYPTRRRSRDLRLAANQEAMEDMMREREREGAGRGEVFVTQIKPAAM